RFAGAENVLLPHVIVQAARTHARRQRLVASLLLEEGQGHGAAPLRLSISSTPSGGVKTKVASGNSRLRSTRENPRLVCWPRLSSNCISRRTGPSKVRLMRSNRVLGRKGCSTKRRI